MAIRVLLVDDQPLLRTGFRMILEAEQDLAVVGEAGDGLQALDQVRALQPDVVLMDIRMPRMDGVEATRQITGPAKDGPHPGRDLAHVIDAHDDQAALEEFRAARVDDRDAWQVALDRLGDALVPDGVAGDVEVVDEKAADRSEFLRGRAVAVPCVYFTDCGGLGIANGQQTVL